MKRPGENDTARRGYLYDAHLAGLDERTAEQYAADMLRMDVIEHVDGWSEDDALFSEWKELRRRTTLPARPRRTHVLRIEPQRRPVFVPGSATMEHIRVILPDGSTAMATAEQVYRLILAQQQDAPMVQEEHAHAG